VTDGPRVALTFDVEHPDRPDHGEHAGEILDELKRLDIRATAFIQGRWAEANPALARRWADDGHLVGSHTFYHARMPLLTEAGFIEDVHEAERVINETVGVDPRPWLRFPFGAGADADDVVGRLPGLGYRHIGWHVEVYEWEPGRTPEEVVDRVIAGVAEHGDGAIVLLHTWPDPIPPALPEIVERLRAQAWRFTRVDELDLSDDLAPVGVPQPGMAAGVT
jgi:peptidoglycan/xylan/chitin deacetylase (PgdA/CDA1 family)